MKPPSHLPSIPKFIGAVIVLLWMLPAVVVFGLFNRKMADKIGLGLRDFYRTLNDK